MLGLKRNEVKLVAHNPEWDTIAAQIIQQLWNIFDSNVEDIQHFGSTAIRHIKAKTYKEFKQKFDIATFEPLNKGWSADKKFIIETAEGEKRLLRIANIAEFDRKKAEYVMLERLYNLGIPTPKPIDFGLCNDGQSVYSVFSWIDGDDLEIHLPMLSEAEKYVMGLKVGEILQKIHKTPAPDGAINWSEKYFSVIDERINAFRNAGILFDGSEVILEYLDVNRSLLINRKQYFIHGDFHEGNLVVTPNNELFVIDFLDEGFENYADPWYDFKTFGENDNAYYSTGLIHGYFSGEPPDEFWETLLYYYLTAALTAIVWTKHHKPDELQQTLLWNEKNAKLISETHSPLMKWYLKNI